MSKKQFTLDSWLKDKRQKVVTRCGFPVRIVCTDVKRKDYPILALVERDDQEEYQSFTKDGRFSLYNSSHDSFDLFIETVDEVSEDEKVREELIKHLKEGAEGYEPAGDSSDYQRWLAWLERQVDYANFRDKAQVGDRITKNEDGVLVNLSQLKRVAKPSEKQCEQKLEMKTAEESLGIDSDTYNKIVDERIFGEQKTKENKGNIGGLSPNWSEEDEVKINRIVACLENLNVADNDILLKDVDWLKSLRPQNRWKPSDEQMGLLQAIINEPNNAASESCQIVLKNILEQLKKLKEEV